MQTYGSLNLAKVRDENGLDFAHFTYRRWQCSCCYGPVDLAARYWVKESRPMVIEYQRHGIKRQDDAEGITDAEYRSLTDAQYILFKNANNGCGYVTANDTICLPPKWIEGKRSSWRLPRYIAVNIMWNFPLEKMDGVIASLRAQLDSDYVVIKPDNEHTCIIIRHKDHVLG